MNPNVVVEFDGGYLRPLKHEDVHPDYISGLNDFEVNRYLDGVKREKQTKQRVVDFVLCNQEATDALLFGIWQAGDECHCGSIRLHGIEYYHKTAHIGVCLFDKSAWGKRLGSKALMAVTRWVFDTLGLRWVEAGVYAENVASQKAFLAAGYEWVYDIPNKYILEGKPAVVKIYAARNANSVLLPPNFHTVTS